MRTSFVKINKNEVLFCGRSNSEIGIFVRYKALCDNFETDALTWKQICSNFDRKERKIVSKLFGILPEVNPKFTQSLTEVNPKLVQSLPEVNPEFDRSLTEVCPQKDNKNNNLARAHTRNILDETRLDETRLDSNSAGAPNKQYAFEGKIIKLKQKDFDAWKLAYPDLNLRGELLQRDIWLQEQPEAEQKRWFISTSQFFIKQNERRKAQNTGIAEQYNTNAKPKTENECWF